MFTLEKKLSGPNKSQHTKLTLEKKILRLLLPGFELPTFWSRADSSALPTSYPSSLMHNLVDDTASQLEGQQWKLTLCQASSTSWPLFARSLEIYHSKSVMLTLWKFEVSWLYWSCKLFTPQFSLLDVYLIPCRLYFTHKKLCQHKSNADSILHSNS